MTSNYFYVIAPVGADPIFTEKRRVLTELGVANDTEPFFPLGRRSSFSPVQAVRDMRAAEFVMADLSLERPSCYYELGLAEGAGIEVLPIAQVGTRIHQVHSPDSVRFFSDLNDYRELVTQILARRVRRAGVRG